MSGRAHWLRAGLASAAILAAAAPQAAELSLMLAGEAYKGAPEFEVLADGVSVGRGIVANAVDTEAAALSDENVAASASRYDFDIPDGTTQVGIRFLQDDWGGVDTGFDRNMYLLSATVDGMAVPIAAMRMQREGATSIPQLVFLSVALVQTNDEAVFDVPAPMVAAGSRCTEVEPVVVNFEINSAALSEKASATLKALAAEVNSGCKLSVTGIVSGNGPADWNKTIATMRAEAIAAALTQELPARATVSARSGTLADTSFGSSAQKGDRIAVVEATPASP